MKRQRNFVSLPINLVIVSKKEFMKKTNCAWVEKWQVKKTNSANPLILSFIFRKHKKLKQYALVLRYFSAISHLIKIWCLYNISNIFIFDFSFPWFFIILDKKNYFRLQLSLVFYYPRYKIVSTSLGSCTGRWATGSSIHSLTPTSLRSP